MFRKNSKVFLISEIGINHEGDVQKCKKMIKQSKKLGMDAAKLQIVSPVESYPKNSKSYKLFTKANFSDDEIQAIFNYAKKVKIKLFATCDTIENINKINKYKPFAFKISSGLANQIFLLKHLVKLKKKIIISVGLLKINDIKKILKELNYYKNIIFMHSISRYPTKETDLNLNSIEFLKTFLKSYEVGFSDHTKDDDAIITSISKGCTFIEKHFTYNKSRSGFDHSISYDFTEMKRLIIKISKLEKSLGENVYLNKKFQKREREIFLRYAVAKKKLKKLNSLKFEDIKFMRINNSKNAIEPTNIKLFLKKKLKKNILVNRPLRINDFKK